MRVLLVFFISIQIASAQVYFINPFLAAGGGVNDFDDIDAQIGLWLDADDTSTLWQTSDCSTTAVSSSGDTVECWEDKSPNAFQFINASSTATWNDTVVNSTGSIFFGTGSNGHLTHADNTVYDLINNTDQEFTIFAVLESSHDDTDTDTVFSFGNYYDDLIQFGLNTHLIFNSGDYTTANHTTAGSGYPVGWVGNTHIVMLRRNDTVDAIIRVDGVDELIDTSVSDWVPDQSTDDLFVGKRYDGQQYEEYLAFLIVYKKALSDREIDSIEALLNARYNTL